MNLPGRTGDQVRFGIALSVPAPHAGMLQEARAGFGDPLAAAIPPHVTLVGPTVAGPEDLELLHAHVAEVAARHSTFEVHLRGTGTFRPVSDVVFVQVVRGIAECEQLEQDLRSGPLAQSLRFHYHPHVTVAHDVPEEALDRAFTELAHFEVVYPVTGLEFFTHGDDGVWRAERHVPFGI